MANRYVVRSKTYTSMYKAFDSESKAIKYAEELFKLENDMTLYVEHQVYNYEWEMVVQCNIVWTPIKE